MYNIVIKDELAEGKDVNITAYQLPLINHKLFNSPALENVELESLFEETRIKLVEHLNQVLF